MNRERGCRNGSVIVANNRRERLVEEGFKEADSGGVGGGEAGLQPLAQRHQGIDLRYDAVLLGKRREGKW